MKLLAMGDLHYTDRQPRLRRDNFFEALTGKLEFIIKLAKKRDAIILQPGDWFDSHKASYSSVTKLLKLLKLHSPLNGIYTVYGQHDLRFHKSDIENTPLNLFHEAFEHVFIAPNEKAIAYPGQRLYIKGASWNEEVPEPTDSNIFNVLLTHRMIYAEKDFPGQESMGTPVNIFLKKHKFDLIVSGDNHKSFTAKVGNHYLINCGALMRTAIDMENHVPKCYIFDTGNRQMEEVIIPHKPFSEVFDFEKHEVEKKIDNQKLEAYVKSLTTGGAPIDLDFIQAMAGKMKLARNQLDPGVFTILEEIMSDGISAR